MMKDIAEEVRKAVGFNTIDPKSMAFINRAMLPTLNRERFEYAGYRGDWHPVYGDCYVVCEKGYAQLVYLRSIDTWVVSPGYKLWGDCSEKKYFVLFSLPEMLTIVSGGVTALAQLRLEGKLQ